MHKKSIMDRQIDRETDRETERQTKKQTEKQKKKLTDGGCEKSTLSATPSFIRAINLSYECRIPRMVTIEGFDGFCFDHHRGIAYNQVRKGRIHSESPTCYFSSALN